MGNCFSFLNRRERTSSLEVPLAFSDQHENYSEKYELRDSYTASRTTSVAGSGTGTPASAPRSFISVSKVEIGSVSTPQTQAKEPLVPGFVPSPRSEADPPGSVAGDRTSQKDISRPDSLFVPMSDGDRVRTPSVMAKQDFIVQLQSKLALTPTPGECPVYVDVPLQKNYALGKTLGRCVQVPKPEISVILISRTCLQGCFCRMSSGHRVVFGSTVGHQGGEPACTQAVRGEIFCLFVCVGRHVLTLGFQGSMDGGKRSPDSPTSAAPEYRIVTRSISDRGDHVSCA
jgi:hypothetical protein